MNMMDALVAAEAMASKKSESPRAQLTPEQEEGKANTVAYVTERVNNGTRMTYARFAEVAQENGWIGESKMSLGQRGAQLVGQLPSEIQYGICQASGRYHKKAISKFMAYLPEVEGKTPEEVIGLLRYVPAEGPGGEVRTYTRAKAEAEE